VPAFVRSREHLLHLLAEAAEIEHNLLCSYLYAAFSLKREAEEDLTPEELAAVRRWRDVILGVCMEEMMHLAQVANLMVAVGSRPHFDRPNLPVAPGYHPAGLQVMLTPFDFDTLEHFIFLERPDVPEVKDGAGYAPAPEDAVARGIEAGVLMPNAPDYRTIGEFYQLLKSGLVGLAGALGESNLFIGPENHQMRADEVGADELAVVSDLATASRAIHLIIVQGEGAVDAADDSHFEQFASIREEYHALLEKRPEFRPSRPVARNPVMRAPQADDRVHVDAAPAALVLDAANAVYSLMLRCLVEVYEVPWEAGAVRSALLNAAIGLMKTVAALSSALTTLPAREGPDAPRAGISFAMLRATEAIAPGTDARIVLLQRFDDIVRQLPKLALDKAVVAEAISHLQSLADGLRAAAPAMRRPMQKGADPAPPDATGAATQL
jgi:hypothetical protein